MCSWCVQNINQKKEKPKVKTLIALALFAASIVGAMAQVHVTGYYRKDGTYVEPHWRSNPNSTTSDNWSTRGNANPYTGEVGTRNNDGLRHYRNSDRNRLTRILTGNGSERPNTNGRTFTATVNDDPKDAFGREHRIELRGLSLSNQCFRINSEEALELATALLVTAYQSETKKNETDKQA